MPYVPGSIIIIAQIKISYRRTSLIKGSHLNAALVVRTGNAKSVGSESLTAWHVAVSLAVSTNELLHDGPVVCSHFTLTKYERAFNMVKNL